MILFPPQVRVKPGESALAFYTAENRSSTPIVGVSTYNVTPMKVRYSFVTAFDYCYLCLWILKIQGLDVPAVVSH